MLIVTAAVLINELSEKDTAPPCTCLFYEKLKDHLEGDDLVAHARVLRIDTVKVIESVFCTNEKALKYYYESDYKTLKAIFEKKNVLKGIVTADTFSVISLNSCAFYFEKK